MQTIFYIFLLLQHRKWSIQKNDAVYDALRIVTYIEEKTFKWRIWITN